VIAKNFTSPLHRAVPIAFTLFALLLLTHRYATMTGDTRVIQLCCSDSFADREIARAFPALPDESRADNFHHAQRFVMQWLAGGLASTGIELSLSRRLRTASHLRRLKSRIMP
jgi:hypothetical protein